MAGKYRKNIWKRPARLEKDLRGHRHHETTVRRHPGGLLRLPAVRLRVGAPGIGSSAKTRKTRSSKGPSKNQLG